MYADDAWHAADVDSNLLEWGTITWSHRLEDLHNWSNDLHKEDWIYTQQVQQWARLQMPHLAVRYVRWIADNACYVTTHALHWRIP